MMHTSRLARIRTLASIFLALVVPRVWASGPKSNTTARLICFGSQAPTSEGDDDHIQVVFIRIPNDLAGPLYLRLFDPDCGGANDEIRGAPDSSTRFSLYGGTGAFSEAANRAARPKREKLEVGKLLKRETYGANPEMDNEWVTFAEISPADGEDLDGFRDFRLVVEGVTGHDGNVFDVAVSRSATRNDVPEGVQLLDYAPTIQLLGTDVAAEMRFAVPSNARELTIANFDAAGAAVTFDSTFRTVKLTSSQNDQAVEQKIQLQPAEAGQTAAITFGGGGDEDPNDARFWVLDDKGQPLAITLPIRVSTRNHRPVPSVTTRLLAECRSVVLDAGDTKDPDGELLQMEWNFGDGQTGHGAQVVHQYAAPGKYRGTLTVTDSSSSIGNGAIEAFGVVINQPPVSVAGSAKVGAPGLPVTFDGSQSSHSDGTVLRYVWDFGDGKTGEGRSLQHAYVEPGKYTVRLKVEDNSGSPCNFATDSLAVWINSPPVAVAGEDIHGSVGDRIAFDGGRSYDRDGKLTSYAWDFGDGATAEGVHAEHAFSKPGSFSVTLKVRDDAGAQNSTATDRLTVFVNDPPIAVAGPDRRLSVGEVSVFDASASRAHDGKIIRYSWEFGDGGKGTGRVIPYAFSSPGTYTVTLTVRDSSPAESGVGRSTLKVDVIAPPVAIAGQDMVVTASTVRFDGTHSSAAGGKILTYDWDFGDGTRGSGAQPVHVYRRPGSYIVKLRVTDDSGTPHNEASSRVTVQVNERPVASAGPDRITAPGESLTLTGAGSFDPDGEIVDYAWTLGDGSTASGRSVTHAWAKPGIYTVGLTVRDNTGDPNAIDYDETVVRVNARPRAKAGPPVLAAPGQQIHLDGRQSFDTDGKIVKYDWSFSDGEGAASTALVSRSFAKPGTYTARLKVIDDSGASNDSDQDEVSIRINGEPHADPGKDIITCDRSVSFDGSASSDPDGDSLTYIWNFGDGATASGQVVTHIFATGGTYPVTLTVDDGTGLSNARNTGFKTATINQPPIARAGKDMTVCAGKVALFDGSGSSDPKGGLLRFRWDLGDGTTFEGVHPTKVYKTGGVYAVKLRVDDDSGMACGFGTDQITVRVVESPVADAGPDRSVCANARVLFDGSKSRNPGGVVNRYVWDFGDGTRGGGVNPDHTFTEPGTYRVRLTVTGDEVGDCPSTDTAEVNVTVLKAPLPKIAARGAVPAGMNMAFDGSGSSGEGAKVLKWDWDFGDKSTAAGATATHSYEKPGRYTAALTITTDSGVTCASARTEKTIVVNKSPVAVAGGNRFVGVNQLTEFDASKSTDDDGVIVSYDWDFGDGETARGVLVRHGYKKSGSYKAVLKVTDDAGLENSTALDVAEVLVSAGPVPRIALDAAACPGEELLFDGSGSTDPNGPIKSYHWRFGDGKEADGVQVRHAYLRPGKYAVTLAVDDGRGVTTSRQELSRTLLVNSTPVPEAGPDVVACVDEAVKLDGSRSTDLDGKIVRYHWSLGDGTEADGERVTHTWEKAGLYKVQLTVTDDVGKTCGVASGSLVVRVNTPPVAVAGSDREAFLGGAHDEVAFDGGKSSDADGDPLTFKWNFGDGTTGAGSNVYHKYTRAGTFRVRLTVDDGAGSRCSESTSAVTVVVKARPEAEPTPRATSEHARSPKEKTP